MDRRGKFLRVAIVGRPNVGKSSLFNRIIGARKAIVYREEGTTRDRVSQETAYKNKRFVLTDTGGFRKRDEGPLLKLVKAQIKKAIDESDILLFVCDGQAGPIGGDFELASILRKSSKRIFLVVNKVENKKTEEGVLDFYQFGLDRPYPVSALHNIGMDGLLEEVIKEFPETAPGEKRLSEICVAIVGRPNVGKSSFVNCLLKEERLIVDERPGTTRDAVDIYFKAQETGFLLIDTAGMRHKRKVKEAVDVYGIMRAKEAIKKSGVCVVLIDGYDGLVVDDLRLLDLVLSAGKCLILCVNKWDLVEGISEADYEEMIYKRAGFLKKHPILFTSAKTGYNVYNSIMLIRQVSERADLKVPTHQLNELLNGAKSRGPFAGKNNRLGLHYMVQARIRPPTFLLFVNNENFVSDEHKNFIENLLRGKFDFFGTPIKFKFRAYKKERKR